MTTLGLRPGFDPAAIAQMKMEGAPNPPNSPNLSGETARMVGNGRFPGTAGAASAPNLPGGPPNLFPGPRMLGDAAESLGGAEQPIAPKKWPIPAVSTLEAKILGELGGLGGGSVCNCDSAPAADPLALIPEGEIEALAAAIRTENLATGAVREIGPAAMEYWRAEAARRLRLIHRRARDAVAWDADAEAERAAITGEEAAPLAGAEDHARQCQGLLNAARPLPGSATTCRSCRRRVWHGSAPSPFPPDLCAACFGKGPPS